MLPKSVRERTDALRCAAVRPRLEHADTGGEREVQAVGMRLVVKLRHGFIATP